LAVPDCGADSGEPACGRAGVDDWNERSTKADRLDLRRGGRTDHVSGLRLLSVGRADEHQVAADWCARQSDRLYERRPARIAHALDGTHARCNDPGDAGVLSCAADMGGNARVQEQSIELRLFLFF
jgi:hypothetical protein